MKSKMLSRRATTLISGLFALLISELAAGAPVLEEIVVPVRKREESLQQGPISIATFSGYASQDTGAAENLGPVAIASRFEVQMTFDGLVQSQRYAQAMPVGERLVELTEAEFGEESVELAQVLMELAETARHAGEYETSEENFLASIEILRESEGIFTEQLIDPLIGLATNYHDSGDHLAALGAYNEAHALYRRVFGLLNEEQIDILDRMTETLTTMDRFEEAREQQVRALRLAERNRGPNSPEVLPAIYKFAGWLRSGYQYGEEREQYVRAMDIIREHDGKKSPQLVRPLRETANSFRAQRSGQSRGASSLKRALAILEAQENKDKLAIATTLRDLGDWKVAFSKSATDGAEYVRAWELLGDVESGEDLRTEWFEQLNYVLYEQPSQRGIVSDDSEPGVQPGFVLVVFDITKSGRTENVVVVESTPPGMKDNSVAQAVRQSRLRPRVVNGEIMRAPTVAHRFNFFFKPKENS